MGQAAQVGVSTSLPSLLTLTSSSGHRNVNELCDVPSNSTPIGQGPFVTVWLAHLKGLGPAVALKALDKRKMKLLHVPACRISREVKVLQEVAGQSGIYARFVQLYDFTETPETSYLVVEYCAGGSLDEALLKTGPPGEAKVAHLMAQILEGLTYLHSKSICHRDVKPQSILLAAGGLLSESAQAKLSGFGLAVHIPKGTVNTQKVGTPAFMAPEVITLPHGSRGYDELVDTWAAGVVMVFLIKGEYLFMDPVSGCLQLEELLAGQLPTSWEKTGARGGSSSPSTLAKDLLERLIQPLPFKRISADVARNHDLFRWSSRAFGGWPLSTAIISSCGACSGCGPWRRRRNGGRIMLVDAMESETSNGTLAYGNGSFPPLADADEAAEVAVIEVNPAAAPYSKMPWSQKDYSWENDEDSATMVFEWG
mmetsp:Transcript_57934/g.130948  ORF Transcript_57934/g.130948 Transcript_57934/m.130948 type:complete len:424 (-) Transcript_57934:75-1346(-)